MKVKEFLEWFDDFDPESELKFELFEEIYNGNLPKCIEEVYTPLEAEYENYSDKDDAVTVTFTK